MITKKNFLKELKKRLFVWSVAFLFSYIFIYLIDPFYYKELIGKPFFYIAEDFFLVLFFSVVIAEVSLLIDHYVNKIVSWNEKSLRRLLIQTVLQIIGSVTIVILINFIFESFSDSTNVDYRKEIVLISQWIATNIIVSLLISAINTGNFLLENWKKTALEAAQHKLKSSEHKRAAMAAELQALKLQIDPHFIFNNLSVLSELILEDQQLGYEYSESFAKVYRYLLVNSKKDTITLEEELKFLNSYIYLTEKRIGEGVHFEISINENYKQFLLPPLSLQFLVENALKHNQTSKSNPLKINISTTNDQYLLVYNTLVPLINNSKSAGLGIKNIINRFEFLGDKKPIILKTDKDFIAKIPLYENQ
ncbi:histidine kinase [Chryseobacterium sp. Ch-15]|uniref:Histidine kinase n=1 Tax=Chryseobacterium muglaense TaxID=2893752 RepID=A0A9Q3UZG1_9FLAO|nr:histidine kinase [Chryseobacterium muglaense]MBD3906461.1 histidine kinase [Chryseobacterium muglaense]MCC9036828.1 histidine kinase [Chryseobacterium muglaense]MCM2556154.1 histidine kinase [Chryseobacterium muglaense]